jgi:hypothetical protein
MIALLCFLLTLFTTITGIAGCCARAASGHAAAPPSSDINVRRFIASPSMQDHAQSAFNSRHQNRKGCRAKWGAVRQMCIAEI